MIRTGPRNADSSVMRSRSVVAAALVLAAAATLFPPAAAAELELDPTFGLIRTPVVAGGGVDVAGALVDATGSVVAAVHAGGGTAVARVLPGGNADAVTMYPGIAPRAVAFADTGELVVAGDDDATAAAVTSLLWLRPDGSVAARATQPAVYAAPYVQTVDAVATVPGAGRDAVVAGTAAGYLLVHRFDGSGARESTTVLPLGDHLRVRAVAALADGTVIVGGALDGRAFVARLARDGDLQWIATLTGGASAVHEEVGDLIVDGNGIVAAFASGATYSLARLSLDGGRDAAFGGSRATAAAAAALPVAGRVDNLDVDAAGYVVSGAGGLAGDGGRSAVAIARFDRDGVPSDDAHAVDVVPFEHERGRALVTDGGLVVIGEAGNGDAHDELFVARVRTADTPPVAGTTTDGADVVADPSSPVDGYWMVDASGGAHPFGAAAWHGNGPAAVDIEATPAGKGYWIVDGAGRVSINGDAHSFGGPPPLAAGETVSALASTPDGTGYWIFTSLGRVVARGTAVHHGDMAGVRLNAPLVDAVATPAGDGYYLVSADGGIFTFGAARFAGSTGNRRLNAPVQSLVPDGDGDGYWLVASDGGVFSFRAGFHGSMGSVTLNQPITGMVGSADGRGYLMVAEDGGVFAFGDAPFFGSLGDRPPAAPVVAIATR